MRTICMIMAALLITAVNAAEKTDTAFTVKDKKIVVDVDKERTKVKVYDLNGTAQTKIRELDFIDGQEVERVFVGSPFIPTEQLQNIKFRPRFPMVWMGVTNLTKSPFSMSTTGIHSRKSKSFELGITPWSFAIPLNKAHTFGITSAIQVAWVHQCFQKDYAVGQDGNTFTYTKLDRKAEGNNMNYAAFRIPVMFSMQYDNVCSISTGFTPELRTDARYRLTPAAGSGMTAVSDTYSLRRFGLNYEMYLSFGPLTLSASAGLIPVLKTDTGVKAYSVSANIGIDVLELCRIIKGGKKKK